eukprot:TRINITY_DN100627_c0_g1_i1.p1 TRINITY_DN100627_c0_g1~~TRINITY_DN100627_c0_g1_i1.p1  ORF type:complete len:502 (-),score=101.67 TRINITY_DN100627_c0_g1_i1:351-1793(-)
MLSKLMAEPVGSSAFVPSLQARRHEGGTGQIPAAVRRVVAAGAVFDQAAERHEGVSAVSGFAALAVAFAAAHQQHDRRRSNVARRAQRQDGTRTRMNYTAVAGTLPTPPPSRSSGFLHTLGEFEAEQLAALRQQLPDILAEAKGSDGASGSLTMWGVGLMESGEASNIILLKFLRATDMDVDAAASRLLNTLKFRQDYQLEGFDSKDLAEHFQGHDVICGSDDLGRPVLLSRYGQMDNDKVFGDADAFVRYRLQIMETVMRELPFRRGAAETLTQVHDYAGVNLIFKTKEVKAAISKMTKSFAEHYPETKGTTIFVNFPQFFAKIFQAFAAFIPEETRKKFVILGESDQALLFEYVRPEMLPESLGGMRRDAVPEALTGGCSTVSLKPGNPKEVDMLEVHSACTVRWELRVCNKQASYTVRFHPVDGETEIVAASDLLRSSEGIVAAEYRAAGPGRLSVTFEDGKSWLQGACCACRAAQA